jgi:hypothetical protein
MWPGRPPKDITGKRFGLLTAVSQAGRTKGAHGGHALWLCQCECGNTKVVAMGNLRPGGVQSCGCLRSIAAAARAKRDGPWNEGKSYAINHGVRCYRTRHAWAKAALRHYGNRCEKCGWCEGRCDVHHRNPKAAGGLHTIENAIVLCPNHHRLTHTSKPT